MTGEMSSITQDGVDQDGNCWSLHAAAARATKGILHRFDMYQGPYIQTEQGRFWIFTTDGFMHFVTHDGKAKATVFFVESPAAAAIAAANLFTFLEKGSKYEVRYVDNAWRMVIDNLVQETKFPTVYECLMGYEDEKDVSFDTVLVDLSGYKGELA